jgi:hypothetical protein
LIKKRDFVHQNIKYSFNWNLKNHEEKILQSQLNREELRKLEIYLKKVYEGVIPHNLFNTSYIPRVSQFKIRGLKNSFISSFSKKLIRAGIIQKFDYSAKLPNYARKVFEIYHKNQFNKIPGHVPILKNILIKDNDSIAIEVPIWSKNQSKYLTGHIDLIQVEDSLIKIIDYKPEGNFLISLPQVATYGLLIKKMLNINNLKCVSFNIKGAWEYNPDILLTEISEYLNTQKILPKWEKYIEK